MFQWIFQCSFWKNTGSQKCSSRRKATYPSEAVRVLSKTQSARCIPNRRGLKRWKQLLTNPLENLRQQILRKDLLGFRTTSQWNYKRQSPLISAPCCTKVGDQQENFWKPTPIPNICCFLQMCLTYQSLLNNSIRCLFRSLFHVFISNLFGKVQI